jgi:FixJ family two-component response regulator
MSFIRSVNVPTMRSNKTPVTAEVHRVQSVLIVDDEPLVRQAIGDALAIGRKVRIIEAGSIAAARAAMNDQPVDLVLVDVQLPDGDGLNFAHEIHEIDDKLQSIVITGDPTLPRAVAALRAGVVDFLTKPLKLEELSACVDRALVRRADTSRMASRVRRLRRLCRKLHRARTQVSQQVDILCNDLVSAYQELSDQMRTVQLTTEFKTILEQELDMEQVLRRMLESVLRHAGSTNAVIFLPTPDKGHSVGGYINYTFDKATADVLLDHLADVAAPRITTSTEPAIHLTDDVDINLWLSDDSAWLSECHVLALPCRHEDQTMASLLLFRDAADPFSQEAIETLKLLVPVFAAHLVKVVGIHHRHKPPVDLCDDDTPF